MPDTQPIRVHTPEAPPANGASQPNGASPVSGVNGTATRSFTTTYVPRITNAQRLAIQSLCTRQSLADWELRRLVWERFAKKEQSELTKEQAGELLNLLQQSAAEGEASDHAYA